MKRKTARGMRSASKALFLCWIAVVARAEGTMLVRTGDVLAYVGDSITNFGKENPRGYVNLVTAGLNEEGVKIVEVPAGVNGNESGDMLARIDGILARKPQFLTYMCGVNDVGHWFEKYWKFKGCSLEDYKKNVVTTFDKCDAAGAKVVVLTPTLVGECLTNRPNAMLSGYVAFLKGEAVRRGYRIADLNAAHIDAVRAANRPDLDRGIMTVDSIHMNEAGNRMIAWCVLRALGVPEDHKGKIEDCWRAIIARNDDKDAVGK